MAIMTCYRLTRLHIPALAPPKPRRTFRISSILRLSFIPSETQGSSFRPPKTHIIANINANLLTTLRTRHSPDRLNAHHRCASPTLPSMIRPPPCRERSAFQSAVVPSSLLFPSERPLRLASSVAGMASPLVAFLHSGHCSTYTELCSLLESDTSYLERTTSKASRKTPFVIPDDALIHRVLR